MKLYLNIKPIVITGKTKGEIYNKLPGHMNISSTYGIYNHNTKDCVIVVNFQKFNKKTKRTAENTIVLRKSHWKAYVYYIPYSVLTALNLKVYQHNRNFTLKMK